MAVEIPLTLHQANDEVMLLTLTRLEATDDLSAVTVLELYLKPDQAVADDDPNVIKLSSSDSGQIIIDTKTAGQITARAFVTAECLAHPYTRWWRVDALAGTSRRTAMYGPVAVVEM